MTFINFFESLIFNMCAFFYFKKQRFERNLSNSVFLRTEKKSPYDPFLFHLWFSYDISEISTFYQAMTFRIVNLSKWANSQRSVKSFWMFWVMDLVVFSLVVSILCDISNLKRIWAEKTGFTLTILYSVLSENFQELISQFYLALNKL